MTRDRLADLADAQLRIDIEQVAASYRFPPLQPLPKPSAGDQSKNHQPWCCQDEFRRGGWGDLAEVWCWYLRIPNRPGGEVDQTPAWSPE